MEKRCRKCGEKLTCEEELYNSQLEQYPICDDCLDKERETFIHKGEGNDPETEEED